MALGAEARFCSLHKLGKRRLVEYSDVGEHLAVHLHRGFLQTVHEAAVGQAVLAHRRVNTRDPQRAKHAFLGPTITIGILAGTHHRFIGDTEYVAATTAEP